MATTKPKVRFGVGEWYGKPLVAMTSTDLVSAAKSAKGKPSQNPGCPFQPERTCGKPGGVCSLAEYRETSGGAELVAHASGTFCVTCPNRFKQDSSIYTWISQALLGKPNARVLNEVGFLERVDDPESEEVGRIDNILVIPGSEPLNWCAVETQAVYFSGPKMGPEFVALGRAAESRLPFPRQIRRPDFRSSGPKRLLPQLQVKVPTLSRWGKKLAVVIDERFFASLAPMKTVDDISSCDVAWFVVDIRLDAKRTLLGHSRVVLTTLEHAVGGLTAAKPVSLSVFERRIAQRLASAPRT